MAFSFVHGARIFGFAKIPVNGNKFFQLQETSPNDFLQADFVKMWRRGNFWCDVRDDIHIYIYKCVYFIYIYCIYTGRPYTHILYIHIHMWFNSMHLSLHILIKMSTRTKPNECNPSCPCQGCCSTTTSCQSSGAPGDKTHHERVRLKQQGRFAKATGRYRRTRRKRPAGPNGERWRKLLEKCKCLSNAKCLKNDDDILWDIIRPNQTTIVDMTNTIVQEKIFANDMKSQRRAKACCPCLSLVATHHCWKSPQWIENFSRVLLFSWPSPFFEGWANSSLLQGDVLRP